MVVNELLTDILSGNPERAVKVLQKSTDEPSAAVCSALRLATRLSGQSPLYYQKLQNLWQNWGKPALKPNVINRKVVLLSDFTADAVAPLLALFCGTWGIHTDVQIPGFDSVEHLALGGDLGDLVIDSETIVVLVLSDEWLSKYLGGTTIVRREGVESVKEMLQSILEGLQDLGPSHIMLANFYGRAFAHPAGQVVHDDILGWNLARTQVNAWLAEQASSRVHIVDIAEAIFMNGGRAALGQANFFRARMAFEPEGAVGAAREIASAIANVCGKSHRAIVCDWDNTLWGGEVAEAGVHGVVCGRESPDGLAYLHVQKFVQELKELGILLAGVSRNDPQTKRIFEENGDLALKLDDFSSLQVGWGPKSQSIVNVSQDMGFGPEFMVFVDDSLFELAEAVQTHPYLDVLRAGPEPDATLNALSTSRFFNVVAMTNEDLQRTEAAKSLKRQREARGRYKNIEEFLQEISISLEVKPLNEENLSRVVQMFQKSNQFNLTTRRHGEEELRQFQGESGKIGVFSYSDAFGSQGIISVVVLTESDQNVQIESWVMSCRVLNRTVEDAVFCWIVDQAKGRPIIGEYIPTEKNKLVKDLYHRFGFEKLDLNVSPGAECFRYVPSSNQEMPKHYAQLRAA